MTFKSYMTLSTLHNLTSHFKPKTLEVMKCSPTLIASVVYTVASLGNVFLCHIPQDLHSASPRRSRAKPQHQARARRVRGRGLGRKGQPGPRTLLFRGCSLHDHLRNSWARSCSCRANISRFQQMFVTWWFRFFKTCTIVENTFDCTRSYKEI